jgi:hypothetical protein
MFPLSWIIGGLTGGMLVAAANFIFYVWILPEVNATLEQGKKITPFMVNFRLLDVLRRHAQLAPISKRRNTMYILLGLGLFCMLAGVLFSLPLTRSI